MRKIVIIILLNIFTVTIAYAGADGDNKMSKKNNGEVKDCFERINRATFAFNQGLDNAIFEPLAKGYRKLPTPIKKGTSNVLSNLSNLITIPNNILQGDFKTAGLNTARLTVNTTVGIFGIFDAASQMGFIKDYKVEVETNKPVLSVDLKYYSGNPVISTFERVSKPGRRIFSSADSLPKINGGLGIAIVSTPKGVMTDVDARKQKIGGEIICKVF